ncbi:hypothetical protein CHS0354_004694 [Potamilus streckersoni]|uniref:Uncharacterized protein n=1 Tax=Potamilus streckersoni TaxID=2493646 RepID=A0AAE0SIS9_9BIVA|nr:hypothetical protein CHS0354_004694 [Potamilus streckersoni]
MNIATCTLGYSATPRHPTILSYSDTDEEIINNYTVTFGHWGRINITLRCYNGSMRTNQQSTTLSHSDTKKATTPHYCHTGTQRKKRHPTTLSR